MARLILRAAPWISIAALAIAWETFARSGAVTPFMLPKLTTVLERMWADSASGEYLSGAGSTPLSFSISMLSAAISRRTFSFAAST